MLNKNGLFQCMGRIFCVGFQRFPLLFDTKYLTLLISEILRAHRFTSSWVFLKRPYFTLDRMCTTCISFANNVRNAHTRHIERSWKRKLNDIPPKMITHLWQLEITLSVVRFIWVFNFCMPGRSMQDSLQWIRYENDGEIELKLSNYGPVFTLRLEWS